MYLWNISIRKGSLRANPRQYLTPWVRYFTCYLPIGIKFKKWDYSIDETAPKETKNIVNWKLSSNYCEWYLGKRFIIYNLTCKIQ